MSRLDDFLEPLHHGVWEVDIPKDSVTEPLDLGWEVSKINIPSPGLLQVIEKDGIMSMKPQPNGGFTSTIMIPNTILSFILLTMHRFSS